MADSAASKETDDPLEATPSDSLYAGDKASKSKLLASFSVSKGFDPGFGQISSLPRQSFVVIKSKIWMANAYCDNYRH